MGSGFWWSTSAPTGGMPDFNQFVAEVWGWGDETPAWLYPTAINFVFGENPPYYLDDFLSVYPKFFGPATIVPGATLMAGSNLITVPSTTGLRAGQFLQTPGLPPGSVIRAVGVNSITVTTNATEDASNAALSVYMTPGIPMAVIQLYVNLAWNSLVWRRWQDSWYVGMGWFIAHYCTLYAKSDASEISSVLLASTHTEQPAGVVPGTTYVLSSVPPTGTLQGLFKNGAFLIPGSDYTLSSSIVTLTQPTVAGDLLQATWSVPTYVQMEGSPSTAQIAAQGLATGIVVSKSVGDVSIGYQALQSLQSWGTWNLTGYGQLLADRASCIGSGPALFW